MWDWTTAILQQYGLSGVVIAFLVYALLRVDTRRDQEIEARYKDALEWQRSLVNNTVAITTIANQLEGQTRAIETLLASQRATNEAVHVLQAGLGRERRQHHEPDA